MGTAKEGPTICSANANKDKKVSSMNNKYLCSLRKDSPDPAKQKNSQNSKSKASKQDLCILRSHLPRTALQSPFKKKCQMHH